MSIKNYLSEQTNAAPLAVFRVFFGLMMCFSCIRFWANGWIEDMYLTPKFHFSYFGFEWVKPLGSYTYILFGIYGLSAFFVALGFKYRWSILVFFLSFTYIELMDKTTYLNHYYFISVLSFLLIFLPAHARFSLDALIQQRSYDYIPKWTIDSVKFLLGIVYVYAGLAKLNSDWLLRAMPLKMWLPSKYDTPILGKLVMHENWFHFAMSWGGALYDLSIPLLLLYKRTRLLAFTLVVFFHVFTRVLFPIGMFPFIMIVSTLIFFESSFHETLIRRIKARFPFGTHKIQNMKYIHYPQLYPNTVRVVVAVFLVLQLLVPFRYLLYPGELFWTEEGYRFSWRVMLMEKAGYTNFKIVDKKNGDLFYVDNNMFLSSFQEKQMSFQPDFILEYAHFLGQYYSENGTKEIGVYVESYVALNGRLSQPYINPKVDLYKVKESFKHKDWILPFNSEIKIYGL